MPFVKSWKEKEKIAKRYNISAQLYNLRYRDEQESKYDAILDIVKINLGEYILDIGCGTGLLIQRIGKNNGITIGIDFSKKMLEEAKKTCRGLENISLICGDADFLPLRDGTINKIFAITLLQNMPQPKQTILEITRIAKDVSEIVLTWQKRIFEEKDLTKWLDNCELNVSKSFNDGQLKDYVHVCIKRNASY
ncbi:MAG: hypothetical protein QG670_1350 [Thermoproteota archaeon]|nr:hypothetical protein [Thermoproteota archaeon]